MFAGRVIEKKKGKSANNGRGEFGEETEEIEVKKEQRRIVVYLPGLSKTGAGSASGDREEPR